jgi:radical SAM protein with 4Fe4S-binding SPASM domain
MINSKKVQFLPTSAVLEMTYACNHQCLFCSCPWEHTQGCYQKGNELSLAEWKDCIQTLLSRGVCSLSYTGGEPLLNPHIQPIISYVSSLKAVHIDENLEEIEMTPHQYLISNGQLVDENLLDFIKEHNVNLSMSLPGLSTYQQHTGSGSCDRILNLFQKAKQRDIRTTVNIAVTKKNLFELYETISNALIAGADTLLLNRFLPGGRGMAYAEDLLLNKDETLEMIRIAEDVLKKANRFGSVGTELPICLIKDLELTHLTVGTQCAAAINFFVVGPEGRIRTCNHSPIQLDSYKTIDNLKTNSYWRQFTQKTYLPDYCVQCSLNYRCDGGCREAAHIYTGNLCGEDPLLNEILKNI